MKKIKLTADSILEVRTNWNDRTIEFEVDKLRLGFIAELSEDEIIMSCNSAEDLLKQLLTYEGMDEVLHEHLRVSGYIFNKA